MRFRFLLAALCTLSIMSVSAHAAGSLCASGTRLTADGRILAFDFIPQASTGWYQFEAVVGRSYSVEVRDDIEDDNGDLNPVTLTTGCGGAAVTVHSTTQLDPVIAANAFRGSFTATASGPVNISVPNANVSLGRYVAISVSDTTVFNPRWSTFSGFVTQYGFQNTTAGAITGKLTVTPVLGSAASPVTITVNVPANGEVFVIVGAANTSDIVIAPSHAGYAVFSHNGPPGGLVTDAYFINPSATVIVPAVFQPVRDKSH
jgi:hypothetical protein